MNHNRDPIPIVPGRKFLIIEQFEHPHGEIHLLDDGTTAVACSGDDDGTDPQCTDLSVPNIIDSNIFDHLGPYDGINIGTIYCT